MIRRCAVPVLAVAMAGSLVACSSSGGGKKSDSPSPTSSSKSAASTAPLTQPPHVPTSVPNSAARRKLVTQTACQSIPGGWENTGTLKNTSDKAVSYTITVFFTTTGATVLSYGNTKVTAAAGKTVNWKVAKKFAATKNMNCVLRGVG